ncbi:Similar to hypothetical protein [Tuber melanosporum Mel28]; acc. no. XP_002835132 [Pyronema omphalodes CBS 100304]|uniref:Uncharacterized protein n=1 Tax=Pyronema omphalodes (strain CBS 100304) TaxID=1076935 RepID=U4L5D3_PYROM|nr:Similar to hypothetical protein [Tuber melanosporum Mel28]; acc. no. XP_002835132 [Pyronema omphalodes CBS 100304]
MNSAAPSHPSSRRHSRRNTGNINFSQMSLTPMTIQLTDEDFSKPAKLARSRGGAVRTASYIAGVSAPTTPTLLSRSPSYHTLPGSPSLSRSRRNSSSEWLSRTGAILSSESRDYKGQGWLSTRASSTSLVAQNPDPDLNHEFYESDHHSLEHVTPMWGPIEESSDYFTHNMNGVRSRRASISRAKAEQEQEEEEEFSQWGLNAFQLGQWVDRLIGWSVGGDESDEETEEEEVEEEECGKRKRARERERLEKMLQVEQERRREEARAKRDGDDEGLGPLAWVAGVVSGVLF